MQDHCFTLCYQRLFYYTGKSTLIYMTTSVWHGKCQSMRRRSQTILFWGQVTYYTIILKQKALFTILKDFRMIIFSTLLRIFFKISLKVVFKIIFILKKKRNKTQKHNNNNDSCQVTQWPEKTTDLNFWVGFVQFTLSKSFWQPIKTKIPHEPLHNAFSTFSLKYESWISTIQ